MTEEDRDTKRDQLLRLINASVSSHGEGTVHYYQGMHDVASVLLMVLGEHAAFPIMSHLTTSHLRDCTR